MIYQQILGKYCPITTPNIHKNKCKSFKYKQLLYTNLITKASNYPTTSSNCFLFLIPLLYHCSLPYRQKVKQSQLHVSRVKCMAAIGYEKMKKRYLLRITCGFIQLSYSGLWHNIMPREICNMEGKGYLFGSIL